MQPKKIYISGKITGLEKQEAFSSFYLAENKIKANFPETKIVNPLTINHDHDLSWESYMRYDLIAMLTCDTIYMLKNWKDSKGATVEYNLAIALKFNVLFE